ESSGAAGATAASGPVRRAASRGDRSAPGSAPSALTRDEDSARGRGRSKRPAALGPGDPPLGPDVPCRPPGDGSTLPAIVTPVRTIYVDKDIPRILAVKALRPVWPGVVFSAVSPARCADLPEPPLPGPRWVRLQNRQCGICATDLSLLYVAVD